MNFAEGKEAAYQMYRESNIKDAERDHADGEEMRRLSIGYITAIFDFAELWASKMEEEMAAGRALEDVAEKLSYEAAKVDGITGFQYGLAVNILSQYWVHGERLRLWHNLARQIGNEGERANAEGAVLNPAVLVLGGGDD
jgi:hypothetical protein